MNETGRRYLVTGASGFIGGHVCEALLRRGWVARYGRNGVLMHHHSPGCEHCGHTGQKGRVGIHELMLVSRDLRHASSADAGSVALTLTAGSLSTYIKALKLGKLLRYDYVPEFQSALYAPQPL